MMVRADAPGPLRRGGATAKRRRAVVVEVQGHLAQRRGPPAAHDVRGAPAPRPVLRGGSDAAPRGALRLDHPHLLSGPARRARERPARMLRAIALGAALAAVVAVGGCGAGKGDHAANPPAQPYSKRSTAAGAVARVTAADYRRPMATYKRYVRRQLGALLGEVGALRSAIARRDLAGARAAWLRGRRSLRVDRRCLRSLRRPRRRRQRPPGGPARRGALARLHGPSPHRARRCGATAPPATRRLPQRDLSRAVARLRSKVARDDHRSARVLAARARDPRGRHPSAALRAGEPVERVSARGAARRGRGHRGGARARCGR